MVATAPAKLDRRAIRARAWELASEFHAQAEIRHGNEQWNRTAVQLRKAAPEPFRGVVADHFAEALRMVVAEARETSKLNAASPELVARMRAAEADAWALDHHNDWRVFGPVAAARRAEGAAIHAQIMGG